MTDVFESVFRRLSSIKCAEDLTDTIIFECLYACLGQSKYVEGDFQFLGMFENSIGNIVSLTLWYV